ncbi:MAG: hypothetical protein PGN11_05105 [Quadrisphaera sp.]
MDDADRALLAAAATGHLDDDERAQLDALLSRDASARAELAELRVVLAELEPLRDPAAAWEERPAPPLAAVVEPVPEPAPAPRAAPAVDRPPHRLPRQLPRQHRPVRRDRGPWRWPPACSSPSAGWAGALVRGAVDERGRAAVVAGPPGTLGAVERVSAQTSAGVGATASVVAHTWGTETLLELTGLEAGRTYQVVVVDDAGTAVVAGTLIGTGGEVDCTMNAAVLRADASPRAGARP